MIEQSDWATARASTSRSTTTQTSRSLRGHEPFVEGTVVAINDLDASEVGVGELRCSYRRMPQAIYCFTFVDSDFGDWTVLEPG